MVAEPRTFVDIEPALREWARDHVPSVNRRVFFGFNASAPFPQIVLFRVFGPDDRALIQWDVWAEAKAQAAEIAAELATAADAIGRYTHDGVLLHGAVVESVRWQPDDESDQPRYVVDTTVMATASQ